MGFEIKQQVGDLRTSKRAELVDFVFAFFSFTKHTYSHTLFIMVSCFQCGSYVTFLMLNKQLFS